MWLVKIEDEASKVFEGDYLTKDDKIVIQIWAHTVAEHGPEELLRKPSIWADHPLHGQWQGHRASSFSHKGRIIYKVEERVVTVVVVRITTEHDYKKKRD